MGWPAGDGAGRGFYRGYRRGGERAEEERRPRLLRSPRGSRDERRAAALGEIKNTTRMPCAASLAAAWVKNAKSCASFSPLGGYRGQGCRWPVRPLLGVLLCLNFCWCELSS